MTEKNGNNVRRVYLDYVGCRLNQAEIEKMGRDFSARGHEVTDQADNADLVVINTCAVTSDAAKTSRKLVRRAARANPGARIVVTGCYAAIRPDTVAGLPGVEAVIDNADKGLLVPMVENLPAFDCEPAQREPLPPGTLGHVRAFVKVQDGCDNECTFCITTVARGSGRSHPLTDVIDEINALVTTGYQEVVLTGVHLGSYGQDMGDAISLRTLVSAILAETDLPRLRLSSLEPWDLDAAFFDLWADSRLMPHLHLPLQAGCDRTLKRMRRHTTTAEFSDLVRSARQRIPSLAITTDVIVGFPGETEDDFEESLHFVESIGFTRLHVFTYSAREGTPAARMKGQIPLTVRKNRNARMNALSERLSMQARTALIGETLPVLWESASGATPDGLIWTGYSDQYFRVRTVTPQPIGNRIMPVRIDAVDGEFLVTSISE